MPTTRQEYTAAAVSALNENVRPGELWDTAIFDGANAGGITTPAPGAAGLPPVGIEAVNLVGATLPRYVPDDGVIAAEGCDCGICNVARAKEKAFYAAQAAGGTPIGVSASAAYQMTKPELCGPVLTRREINLRSFEARGIIPIPDEECTDMGDYVIWNNWTARELVMTVAPDEINGYVETIEDRQAWSGRSLAATQRVVSAENRRAHPTKPVRIVGWIELARDYWVCYEVGAGNGQKYTTFSPTQVYGSDYAYSNIEKHSDAVRLAKRPKEVVALLIKVLQRRLTSEGRVPRQLEINLESNRLARLAIPGRGTCFWRYTTHSADTYKARRALYRAIGNTLRCPDRHDRDSIIDLLNDQLLDSDKPFRAKMAALWNVREAIGDTVEFADRCGHVERDGDTHSVIGGYHVCDDCFQADYVYVEDLDGHGNRDDMYCHSDGMYYSYREDGESDSDDPSENMVGGRVKPYNDNVLRYAKEDTGIASSQYGNFLMGIELEVAPTKSHLKSETVVHTMDNLTAGYGIMKNDGSLPPGGFEIVTAPRGVAEHITRFGTWEPHPKLRAWDTGKCGLHVHITTKAFSKGTLGKFIEFINAAANDGMILKIAGRTATTDRTAATYCRRDGCVVYGNPKMTLSGKDSEKYRMVNTRNMSMDEAERLGIGYNHSPSNKGINTVELRIFRASLKKGRMLAQIEFAHAAVMFCRWTSMRELREEHFLAWLQKSAGMYPNLAKWFGVRSNTAKVIEMPEVRTAAEV